METEEELQNKQKRPKRSEVILRRKAIEALIKSASAEKDHCASFPHLQKFEKNGLVLHLESGSGQQLSPWMKQYIQRLLKANMEAPYGEEWEDEKKIKHKEMVAPEARYIFVRKNATSSLEVIDNHETSDYQVCWTGGGDPVVGFVHYRFVIEEEVPVLYIYELQLDHCVQGKGLGEFLMQLMEHIAGKNHMGALMLTVQKANTSAMHFYLNKLRYTVSSMSPSRVDPLNGAEKTYEILCKTLDADAKMKLEEDIT